MKICPLLLALWFTIISFSSVANVGSHCLPIERTVWSCQAGVKIYSLCASEKLDRTTGYLQYRAGRSDAIEFRFPEIGKHPSKAFHFGLLPHGAAMSFKNGKYEYVLSEDLKGETSIFVSGVGKSGSVQCDASTYSLTLNETIELIANAGIQ